MGGRLRDLTDKEFFGRYRCDRFTANVLANRFRYVVSHMSNQFRWHAFSPIIRDSADLCGMLSGPPSLGYPMAAVSETVPLFWGSIPDAVRIVLEEYGPERLASGDTACYERADLGADHEIEGPAIVWEEAATTLVPAFRRAAVGEHGELVIA